MLHAETISSCTKGFPPTLGREIGEALERRIVSLNDELRELECSQVESDRADYLKKLISNLQNQLSDVRDQAIS